MGSANVIKPAQLLGKDPAKLSQVMQLRSCCLLLNLDLHMLQARGIFHVCTTWRYWIDEKFLKNHFCLLPGVLLPEKNPEHTIPSAFRKISYLALFESLHNYLEVTTQMKTPEIFLWDSECKTLLKHLPTYLFGNKIIGIKQTLKCKQNSLG